MSYDVKNFWIAPRQTTKGAEVIHGATFISVFFVTLLYLAVGLFSEGVWIFASNLLLNGYPVMLQRVNRWRVQQVRASTREVHDLLA